MSSQYCEPEAASITRRDTIVAATPIPISRSYSNCCIGHRLNCARVSLSVQGATVLCIRRILSDWRCVCCSGTLAAKSKFKLNSYAYDDSQCRKQPSHRAFRELGPQESNRA